MSNCSGLSNQTECLSLDSDGAQHFPLHAEACLPELEAIAAGVPSGQAGIRMHGHANVAKLLLSRGRISKLVQSLGGASYQPVRCIFFNKSPETNWSLAWHQDRTICVRERIDQPGSRPWTIKQGIHHVAPPMGILDRMITLRIHLDDAPANNAPLQVALGTHRLGRIAEDQIDAMVLRHPVHACLAKAGDIWAYSTPILHASDASSSGAQRRVLQVDFSPDDLPGELEWLSV